MPIKSMKTKLYDKIHIEISNICNLQCTFCPEVLRDKKIMELETFQKIAEQVQALTDQVALHLMGDPLLHPKFHQFVNVCEQYDLKINLVTNGTLLKSQHFDLLLKPIFRQVNFSIHSFKNNFPDKDATDYLNKIFEFTELAFQHRPDLYINYRLWNLQDTLANTQSSYGNREMLEKICQHFEFTLPEETFNKNKKSVPIKNRLYFHFDTEFVWPSLDLPNLGHQGTCYGLRSHFGILADGTLVPCCLDKEGVIALGSVHQASIDEILNSQRAQEILDGFLKRQLVEELCQKCQYNRRFKRYRHTYGTQGISL